MGHSSKRDAKISVLLVNQSMLKGKLQLRRRYRFKTYLKY